MHVTTPTPNSPGPKFQTFSSGYPRREWGQHLLHIWLRMSAFISTKKGWPHEKKRLLTRGCFEYQAPCIMFFSETWWHPEIPDCLVKIEVFSHIRSDRNKPSGKSKGGMLYLYINDKWCRQPHSALMLSRYVSLSGCPTYPESLVRSLCLCAPKSPKSIPQGQQNRYTPNTTIFIMGDLYHCKWNTVLPYFEKYIKCDIRKNRTLDKCYGNLKHAYTAIAKPPLSNFDHNTVHLIPTYMAALQSSKALVKSINAWTDDSIETLKAFYA